MPRYLPNSTATATLDASPFRPKLSALPKKLAAALTERDALAVRLGEAQTRVNELSSTALDTAAQAKDDAAATAAARTGKPIPPATATAQLAREREEAARALEAHRTAHTALTAEASEVRDEVRDFDRREALREEARQRITVLADQLADEVEASVERLAVQDFLCNGTYDTRAATWPTEVCPSLTSRIRRHETTPEPVRDIIRRAALTVLED